MSEKFLETAMDLISAKNEQELDKLLEKEGVSRCELLNMIRESAREKLEFLKKEVGYEV